MCNANYGDTGWIGLNEVELQNGYITASVAKMNEYYLRNADFEKRKYTMCHELGHGFGLPHTDENFNNPDSGNCLDYTDTPENNDQPGEVNFVKLRELYLNDGSNVDGTANEQGTASNTARNIDDEEGEETDGNRRSVRRVVVRKYFTVEDVGLN